MYRAAWPQWPKLLPGCLLPLACSHTKPDWATNIFTSSFIGRLFGCFLKYLVGFNLVDRVDLLGEVAEKPRFHRFERPWKITACWLSWGTEIKHFCGIQSSIKCGVSSQRNLCNFSAHSAYFNVMRQNVPYFNISRQNRVVFNCFATK